MPDRIVLIDGHALVYRAYHALPPLTSPKGEVVNAVYGFASMLMKVCGELKPRYLIATFDTSSQTFRREEFEAYKGTRAPAPEGISAQFGHVYRLLDAMRFQASIAPSVMASTRLPSKSTTPDGRIDETVRP